MYKKIFGITVQMLLWQSTITPLENAILFPIEPQHTVTADVNIHELFGKNRSPQEYKAALGALAHILQVYDNGVKVLNTWLATVKPGLAAYANDEAAHTATFGSFSAENLPCWVPQLNNFRRGTQKNSGLFRSTYTGILRNGAKSDHEYAILQALKQSYDPRLKFAALIVEKNGAYYAPALQKAWRTFVPVHALLASLLQPAYPHLDPDRAREYCQPISYLCSNIITVYRIIKQYYRTQMLFVHDENKYFADLKKVSYTYINRLLTEYLQRRPLMIILNHALFKELAPLQGWQSICMPYVPVTVEPFQQISDAQSPNICYTVFLGPKSASAPIPGLEQHHHRLAYQEKHPERAHTINELLKSKNYSALFSFLQQSLDPSLHCYILYGRQEIHFFDDRYEVGITLPGSIEIENSAFIRWGMFQWRWNSKNGLLHLSFADYKENEKKLLLACSTYCPATLVSPEQSASG